MPQAGRVNPTASCHQAAPVYTLKWWVGKGSTPSNVGDKSHHGGGIAHALGHGGGIAPGTAPAPATGAAVVSAHASGLDDAAAVVSACGLDVGAVAVRGAAMA